MKTFLIIYIIAVNLVSFALMGIDKRRAVRHRWRIPERTLLLFALLFGSIGALTGMYVFHHKTKHLIFKIGIPCMLLVQLFLLCFLLFLQQKRLSSPSRAVRYELSLIQEQDDAAIESFVSYENLTGSLLSSETAGASAVSAVRMFFRDFQYNILDEQINGSHADVLVSLSNLDMHALAKDVCTEICRSSSEIYPESSGQQDYFHLLSDTISNGNYETVKTEATFHLEKTDGRWRILSDAQLEYELVGGFISYMNDPYILSAEEVLSLRLDAFRSLSGEEWKQYLRIEDVFSTYNTDYSGQIDEQFTAQIARCFDYEILSCEEHDADASAVVRITSLNMEEVLTRYKKYLLAYAGTTKSIRDNSVQVSNEMSRLLLESLTENTDTVETDLELNFRNNGRTWSISFDSSFTNAVMGDISSALDTFNELTRSSFSSDEE